MIPFNDILHRILSQKLAYLWCDSTNFYLAAREIGSVSSNGTLRSISLMCQTYPSGDVSRVCEQLAQESVPISASTRYKIGSYLLAPRRRLLATFEPTFCILLLAFTRQSIVRVELWLFRAFAVTATSGMVQPSPLNTLKHWICFILDWIICKFWFSNVFWPFLKKSFSFKNFISSMEFT